MGILSSIAAVAAPIVGGMVAGPVGAAIGGSVSSAIIGMDAADSAADAARDTSESQIGESRRQFDLIYGDNQPYRETGAGALGRLNALSEGDMSSFYKSPGYNFNLEEGQKAIDRSLSSRGRALSGTGVKEGQRYASGLASNEFGNYWNRQAGLAGIGQSSVNNTSQTGLSTGNAIGNSLLNAGNARQNAYLTGGQAINDSIQGGISNYLLGDYLKNTGTMAPNKVIPSPY